MVRNQLPAQVVELLHCSQKLEYFEMNMKRQEKEQLSLTCRLHFPCSCLMKKKKIKRFFSFCSCRFIFILKYPLIFVSSVLLNIIGNNYITSVRFVSIYLLLLVVSLEFHWIAVQYDRREIAIIFLCRLFAPDFCTAKPLFVQYSRLEELLNWISSLRIIDVKRTRRGTLTIIYTPATCY